jgi:ribonuclease T2
MAVFYSFALLPVILAAVMLLSCLAAAASSTTAFDYYVFAYTWTPQFCYGHTTTYPGCTAPKNFWGEYFTIHGLWPQNFDGTYPAECTTEPLDTKVPTEIGWDTMTTYWPNVQSAETDPNYDSFWSHEWTKHGTCSGLSQTLYFNSTINLAMAFGTPSEYTAAVGKTIDANELRELLGGRSYASLQCSGGKYITGVYTCWSKVNGIPQAQIECGNDVQKEDTCTSTTLTIESFAEN